MARKPAKKKTKSDFPLLDHVDKLMARLHELTPAALNDFDAEAIHQSRVATRRLKAAVDLMKPVLSKRHRKPLADGLRRLRRRLGPLRDADVLIDHLGDLRKEAKHREAAAWLAGRLVVERDRLRAESKEGASPAKELRRVEGWPLVRKEIEEARQAVDGLLAESLHLQTDKFAEQADRLAADLGDERNDEPPVDTLDVDDEATTADGDGGSVAAAAAPARQNPHDLRIAGKALRYTLEMAEVEGRSPGAAVMKQFKRMQELLGTWHDFVVLADRAMLSVAGSQLAHHDAAAAEDAIDLAKHAVRRSSQDLSAFLKLWQQQGEKLAQRIRSAFPLTSPIQTPASDDASREPSGSAAGPDGAAPLEVPQADADDEDAVTRSQTDPGPSGSASPAAPEAAG